MSVFLASILSQLHAHHDQSAKLACTNPADRRCLTPCRLKQQQNAVRFLSAMLHASYHCKSGPKLQNLHSIHSAENQFTYNGLKFHMQFSKYRVSLLMDTTEHRFYTNLFQPIAYPVWLTSLVQKACFGAAAAAVELLKYFASPLRHWESPYEIEKENHIYSTWDCYFFKVQKISSRV